MVSINYENTLKIVPREILVHEIFCYLSLEDLIYLGSTNKYYKNIIDKYMRKLGQKVLQFPKHKDKKQFFSRLEFKMNLDQLYKQFHYKIHFISSFNLFSIQDFSNEFKKDAIQLFETLQGKQIIKPSIFQFMKNSEPNYFINEQTDKYTETRIISKLFPHIHSKILSLDFENLDILLLKKEINLILYKLFMH